MHAMIFPSGWETKSLNKKLSYGFTSMSNDMKCVNTLAHCFYKVSIEIYGGVPPTLDDIQY